MLYGKHGVQKGNIAKSAIYRDSRGLTATLASLGPGGPPVGAHRPRTAPQHGPATRPPAARA
eukprot:6181117-Pleurochrysis_carterae.AAC.2